MKKKNFIGVLSAAVVMTLCLPVQASAASWLPFLGEADNEYILTDKCDNGCTHTYADTLNSKITVDSGKHKIIFEGAKLEYKNAGNAGSPLTICRSAEVILELHGDSVLSASPNYAGIEMQEGAKLTICTSAEDNGSLTVTGGDNASGIGGKAGEYVGDITLNGGTVTAVGVKKGAGIGSNELKINGGSLDVTEGGISSKTLSSEERIPLFIQGKINSGTGKKDFNGIMVSGNNYTVYGNTVWKPQTLSSEETILMEGAHLILPPNFQNGGQIKGAGVLVAFSESVYLPPAGDKIEENIKRRLMINKSDIIIKGDDTTEWVYTGKDLKTDMFEIRQKRGVATTEGEYKEFDLDTTDWDFKIEKTVNNKTETSKGIIDAADYSIRYENPKLADLGWGDNIMAVNRTVKPKSLKEGEVTDNAASLPKSVYTGSECKPVPTLVYKNERLLLTKDFTLTYENNVDSNTNNISNPQPVIQVTGIGNFKDTRTINFDIEPADLSKSNVSFTVRLEDKIGEDNGDVYDKEAKDLSCTVNLDDHKLTGDTDYKVSVTKPEEFALGKAGFYTVAVTGQNNCVGTATQEIEIKQKPIVIDILKAENRPYDATTKVKVKELTLKSDDMETGDDVKADLTDENVLYAYISDPDVETYSQVTFDKEKIIPLTGVGAENYKVDVSKAINLTEEVEITQVKNIAAPTVTAPYTAHPDKKDKFQCKVSVSWPEGSNPVPGEVVYEYAKVAETDEEEVVENPDATSEEDLSYETKSEGIYTIDPADPTDPDAKPPVYIFYARVKGNKNVETGAPGKVKVTFVQLPREQKPSDFILKYTENDDKETFTAEIPEFEDPDVEYSFDGENWDAKKRKKTDCESGMPYTGYVRFKETPVYLESEWTTSTSEAPRVKTKEPVVSPDGGKILGKQTVSITCETEGAKIYYTLDNTEPTEASKEYTGEFDISSAATVKAIAVKPGMEPSSVVKASFTEGDVKSKPKVVKGIKEISEDLKATEFNTPDAVKEKLKAVLTAMEGYTEDKIAYYDISLEVSLDGVNWVPATVDNFPVKGVEVTVDYPEGTGKDTHDFAVCHMFGETSDRLGITAGETEQPAVTKTAQGLKFTMKGMSPVAVAWKEAKVADNKPDNTKPDDTNPDNTKPDNTKPDDTKPDNTNPDNTKPDDKKPNDNNQNGNNNTTNPGGNNQNGSGSNTNQGSAVGGGNNTNQNQSGTNSGNNIDQKTAGSDNGAMATLKKLVNPKTGDPANILFWLVSMDLGLAGIAGALAKGMKRK